MKEGSNLCIENREVKQTLICPAEEGKPRCAKLLLKEPKFREDITAITSQTEVTTKEGGKSSLSQG